MSLASMLNLSIHPKVMIMDEPMSGLDVIAQKQIKDFIVNEVDMNGDECSDLITRFKRI